MASSTLARSLFWILLCSGPVATFARGDQAAQRAHETTSWSIEVLTFEPTTPTFVWAGLVNTGDTRLVCILYRGVAFTQEDGAFKLQGSGMSPHACQTTDQFQLVRAGQTLFTRLSLPKKLAERATGKIRVELSLVDRPPVGKASRREGVDVTWEGSLQEAADLGRQLVGTAKK